jgi:hypothetical protein
MPPVQAALATLNLVKLQDPVQALPQVGIADRNQLSKRFPPPPVLTPFGQPVLKALLDVAAAADHSDPRRLVERFQCANDDEQIKPLAPNVGLDIGGLEVGRVVRRPQLESPMPQAAVSICLAQQQVVRG